MNRYQREKIKRMKKLANLGIGYHQQKTLLRKYSPEQIDGIIKQVNIIKKSDILKNVLKSMGKVGEILTKMFKK